MGLTADVVKASISSIALAAWKIAGEPVWKAWIESRGGAVGSGEYALGYFVVLMSSWGLSRYLARRMERNES